MIGPASEKISDSTPNWLDSSHETPNATRMPRNIATPPSRGVGRVWTSRSRIFG